MNNNEIVKQLTHLIKLDVDAVYAYEQALAQIDDIIIYKKISEFKKDHKQHIIALSECLKNINETPPNLIPDIKYFFIKGFMTLRSLTGIEGALKSMRTNEKLTTKIYANAVELTFPSEIQVVIEKNYADKKRHLEYIEHAVANEVWKKI